MGVRVAAINKAEQDDLMVFLRKHPIYPYRYLFNQTISDTNFASTETGVRYFTMSFTPEQTLGIVSLTTGFIITPNTTVDIFGMVVSYKKTLSLTQASDLTKPVNESDDIYQCLSNGGAINDFQVFYPLNWLLERNQTLYVHCFAGTTTSTAGTSAMKGHIIFGTLRGGI